jgi:hypothetical protein
LANNFAVSLRGRWLGFGALFLNFQCSKQAFYYPVLTDVTALFLGMLLLLFYVEKRPIGLLVTAILGALTWQVTGLSGAVLLLFLEQAVAGEGATKSYVSMSPKFVHAFKMAWVMLLVVAIATCGILGAVEALVGVERTRLWHLIELQFYVTSLPSLFGAFFALLVLVDSRSSVAKWVRSLKSTRPLLIGLSIAALIIPWLVVHAIANRTLVDANSARGVLQLLLAPARGKFLLPLVAQTVFWGPMVLLLLLNWRAFSLQARKLGPGFVAVVGLSVTLALTTEPRFITLGWPFLVLGGVLMMERMAVASSFKYVYPLITIVSAQFWIKLNLAPWPADDYADIKVFPKQMYFMHHGLWMAWWPYAIQFACICCCLVWLHRTIRPIGPVELAPGS